MDLTSGIVTMVYRVTGWLHLEHRLEGAERGQGMVEYALVLVLIAMVVIVVLQILGQQVNNVFSNVSNGLAA